MHSLHPLSFSIFISLFRTLLPYQDVIQLYESIQIEHISLDTTNDQCLEAFHCSSVVNGLCPIELSIEHYLLYPSNLFRIFSSQYFTFALLLPSLSFLSHASLDFYFSALYIKYLHFSFFLFPPSIYFTFSFFFKSYLCLLHV